MKNKRGRPPKQNKRPVGRPKKKPMSAEELRIEAQQKVRASAERRLGINDINVEDFVHRTSDITGKHKFTREEMNTIRERLDLLYQKFVDDRQEREAFDRALFAEAARVSTWMTQEPSSQKQMSRDEWAEEHGLRKNLKHRKPGPPKKKKKVIWDIAPGDKGLASAPGEAPHFDIELAEEQWLQIKMQEHLEMLEEEKQFLKGKRYRPDELPKRNADEQRNFWI